MPNGFRAGASGLSTRSTAPRNSSRVSRSSWSRSRSPRTACRCSACTYNPIKRELFWAVRGAGCFLDDSPRARDRSRRPCAARWCSPAAARLRAANGTPIKDKIVAKPIGSVAYKLALVAAGKADGTFTRHAQERMGHRLGRRAARRGGRRDDRHPRRSDSLQSQARQVRRLRRRRTRAARGAQQIANQKIALGGRAGILNRRISSAGGAAAAGNPMAGARRCAARCQILRSPLPHTSNATSPTR